MSNSEPNANNKENNYENPIPARRYPCPHCSKTFPTSMGMRGHQNAHRKRGEKQPIFTSQGASGLSSSPAFTIGSFGTLQLVGPVRESPCSDPFSRNTRYLQEYFTRMRTEEYLLSLRCHLSAPLAPHPVPVHLLAPSPPPAPLAPQEQPRSTMLFGVPDFFKSVASTAPSDDGASSAGREEEEGEMDLNLDLKL